MKNVAKAAKRLMSPSNLVEFKKVLEEEQTAIIKALLSPDTDIQQPEIFRLRGQAQVVALLIRAVGDELAALRK